MYQFCQRLAQHKTHSSDGGSCEECFSCRAMMAGISYDQPEPKTRVSGKKGGHTKRLSVRWDLNPRPQSRESLELYQGAGSTGLPAFGVTITVTIIAYVVACKLSACAGLRSGPNMAESRDSVFPTLLLVHMMPQHGDCNAPASRWSPNRHPQRAVQREQYRLESGTERAVQIRERYIVSHGKWSRNWGKGSLWDRLRQVGNGIKYQRDRSGSIKCWWDRWRGTLRILEISRNSQWKVIRQGGSPDCFLHGNRQQLLSFLIQYYSHNLVYYHDYFYHSYHHCSIQY